MELVKTNGTWISLLMIKTNINSLNSNLIQLNEINSRTCVVYSGDAWEEVLLWQARSDKKILSMVMTSCNLWVNLEINQVLME